MYWWRAVGRQVQLLTLRVFVDIHKRQRSILRFQCIVSRWLRLFRRLKRQRRALRIQHLVSRGDWHFLDDVSTSGVPYVFNTTLFFGAWEFLGGISDVTFNTMFINYKKTYHRIPYKRFLRCLLKQKDWYVVVNMIVENDMFDETHWFSISWIRTTARFTHVNMVH